MHWYCAKLYNENKGGWSFERPNTAIKSAGPGNQHCWKAKGTTLLFVITY